MVFCFSFILKLKHSAVSTSIDLVILIYLSLRVLLSQQVRNWKIHECDPSNLSSLCSIMLNRFCAISENFSLFPFQNMKYEKSSKISLCKQVLYNYRICFVNLKLKSELQKSSSYFFVVSLFFRGVMHQKKLRRKTS